ncbi:MAG: hypothetical protein ACXAAM_03715 [Candidatus Heimdallarchaeaceae archaeon]|jgi:hypothetical protein
MPKFSFDEEIKEIIDDILLEIPEVEPGHAFGLPGYYVNGKLFASVYESGLTLKLPKEKCSDLIERVDGFDAFAPLGNAMKEWVHITKEDPNDFENDIELMIESLNFVKVISKN